MRYPSSACLPASSILKRAPRKRPGRVAFNGTTVFYFPRCQGFTSVPSRGGCTLGMAPRHSACRRFSLAEFAQEQARARREKLRLRLKEEKLEVLRSKVGDPTEVHSEGLEVHSEGILSLGGRGTRGRCWFARCLGKDMHGASGGLIRTCCLDDVQAEWGMVPEPV